MKRTRRIVHATCVKNDGYDLSLQLRKKYRVIRDARVESLKLLRVVDESGEDYLYPADYLKLPTRTRPR
jgi:hypothetical protein